MSDRRTKHRETFEDDSPRGEQYPDDRTELAYAYEGEELLAIAYEEELVKDWLGRTWFEVVLTPAGEARLGERTVPREDKSE